MRISILYIIILIIFSYSCLLSQKDTIRYINPTDGRILLTGTYGELRSNHFHTGIDIKTASTGKNVYAVQSGYVSRINVSPFGYGKSIYIDHPDGNTSVYGHLMAYSEKIDRFIKKKQYLHKSYTLNVYPDPGEIPVEQGEIIGYSGNSGLSFGPHLHFEIRNTQSEIPINPLHYIDIVDHTLPILKNLYIIPLDSNLYEMDESKTRIAINKSGHNIVINNQTVHTNNFILGIEAYDKVTYSDNICGLYQIKLYVDSILYGHIVFDSISFFKFHFINSFIDYKNNVLKGQWIQKIYKSENNNLDIYKTLINKGIIHFTDDNQQHQILIELLDFYGNTTDVSFKIRTQNKTTLISDRSCDFTIDLNKTYKIVKNEITVEFPDSLFSENNYCFNIHKDSINRFSTLSDLYYVGNYIDAGFKKYSMSIFPSNYKKINSKKLLIAYINSRNGIVSLGGSFDNGCITAETKYFGRFTVLSDTIPPVIKPINITENKNLSVQKNICFKISDNLSGIMEYNGYIDGKWVLFEYEPKKNQICYTFDNHIKKTHSTHNFLLIVSDERENVNTFITSFIY